MSTPFSSIGNHPFIAPLGLPQGGPPQGMPGLFTLGDLPHNMPGPQIGGDLAEPWLGGSGVGAALVVHLPQDFPVLPQDGDGLPAKRGIKRSHEDNGYGHANGADADTPQGVSRKKPSPSASFEAPSDPVRDDAEMRWAQRESLLATKARPSKTKPLTEALCDKLDRPKWDASLNGRAVPRKGPDNRAQDLRHVVAYETMQSAVHSVLRVAKTDQDNYATLDQLATAMGERPTGADAQQRALSTVGKLNSFLFVCKGNFFLGDALENQRAGSSTAALHHTEDARLQELAAASGEADILSVLGQATRSLSGPVLDHALDAFGLPKLGERPAPGLDENPNAVDRQYDANKKAAQHQLANSILASQPLLEGYRAEADPGEKSIWLTLLKSEVAHVIEGLADSTAYDASRTAHIGLGESQKDLPEAFALFRSAERTGNPQHLLEAVQIMKAIDDAARDMAPEVLARKNGTAMKPSFGPLYQQPNQ